MMDRRLEIELAGLADRHRRVRLYAGLSLCWIVAAAVFALTFALGLAGSWNVRVPTLVAAALSLSAAIGVYLLTQRRARNLLLAARQIEQKFPDLEQRLLAAIEQDRVLPPGQPGYLAQLVVREAVEHSRRYDWSDTVPASRLAGARLLHAGALALMIGAFVAAWRYGPSGTMDSRTHARAGAGQYRVTVEPGNTSVERGTDVLIVARFTGQLPADVHVVTESNSGSRRQALAKSLNDPLFGGRISAVATNLTYHVEFDGQHTAEYAITVFDYPDVLRIDAELAFPGYTGLPTRRIEDTRHVSAVEGSTVTLICRLNKLVSRAWLTDESGSELDLAIVSADTVECRRTMTLTRNQRYSVHLVDGEGRSNKIAPEITLAALPDRPPELVLKFPSRDVRASPLEEVALQAEAWDDFGITAYGVTTMQGGQPAQSIELGRAVPAKEKRVIEHTLYLEDLRVQPDQLLSYYFWAEDAGPDGKSRRTRSDMFFVEVRPFEEIYRQGQQPTDSEMRQQQNQGEAAQQAGQLAELQKQIVNATWKLIRQTNAVPADRARDAGVIRDSQKSARDQLQELAQRARAPNAAGAIAEIDRYMASAIEQLAQAAEQSTAEPLEAGLSSEQAAYQALLKLRAREHEVIRSRQMAQRGSGAANRADRQLQELELDSRENRYENRRTPAPAQPQGAREDNQVLNRLRELARRQEDLNKRVQDLQIALQAARDESQRKELERQLQRLREEQQEILRDLDELRDRMNRPDNQQRMADARERLEETRQNMRQVSESLREQQMAPALNSGTRAERELEQVRDDFRRRTANQFADEMRSMRDDAQELARVEQDLGDRLDRMTNAPRQSLRDEERTSTIEQIVEQRKRLSELTDEMKTVSEAAETVEPLLSKQLYDTYRDTTQHNVDRSMEMTSELLRRGFVPEANKTEQTVRQEVDRVRAGVERAARSVLGDPAEATRRALDEVQNLTRQLQQEIAQADPDGESREAGQAGRAPNAAAEGGEQRAETRRTQSGDESARQADQAERTESRQSQRPDASAPDRPEGRGNRADANGARDTPGAQQNRDSAGTGTEANSNERRSGPARPNAGGPSGDQRRVDVAGWTSSAGPIRGDEFRQWSDRLREVEEMLDNPDLRADVAEINDRARDVRRDLKRHSQEPNWSMVRRLIAEPLVELQTKLREELARQEASDTLVPIDRDPVPRRFSEMVRQYYERLGSGK